MLYTFVGISLSLSLQFSKLSELVCRTLDPYEASSLQRFMYALGGGGRKKEGENTYVLWADRP